MLKNKLYRIDKWISKDNKVLLVLLLLVVAPAVMIQFTSTMFYGIGLFIFICLWVVYVKTPILGGQLKFDKSLYTLPIIGERIVVQKDFRYDCNKVRNSKNYIHNKVIINIDIGYEYEVVDIKELDDDWIVELTFTSALLNKDLILQVFWLDVKNYFMTIADIREEKLKKILNGN
jgi:hypothetical protein